MKEIAYKIRSKFVNKSWEKSDKFKVLIEINNYFTQDKWSSVFGKNKQSNRYDVKYIKNKYEGYKLVKDANAFFSFGDNCHYDKRNLALLYYGISQPDLSDNTVPNVFYAKGFSGQSIAEYCLTYSLILVNGFNKYFDNQYKKMWKQHPINEFSMTTLSNKVIGVLGLGDNGMKVAGLFRKIGCKVYGYDVKNNNAGSVDVFCDNINDLLKNSDILIATVNLTPETKNIFNYDSLSLMNQNAFLINVSRGGIIKEDDLYRILKGNQIAGAALDVTVDEPMSRYNKLWSLNNLIITPHISGNINKYAVEVMNDFLDKLNNITIN